MKKVQRASLDRKKACQSGLQVLAGFKQERVRERQSNGRGQWVDWWQREARQVRQFCSGSTYDLSNRRKLRLTECFPGASFHLIFSTTLPPFSRWRSLGPEKLSLANSSDSLSNVKTLFHEHMVANVLCSSAALPGPLKGREAHPSYPQGCTSHSTLGSWLPRT